MPITIYQPHHVMLETLLAAVVSISLSTHFGDDEYQPIAFLFPIAGILDAERFM